VRRSATLIAAVAIPVSIVATFTVMRYLDFGYGAALVVVTFLLLVLVVAIATYLLNRSRTHTSGAV